MAATCQLDDPLPIETATYVSQLNSSYPGSSDPLSEADNHMRLIKATVQATFPNFTAAALSATQAQLDAVVAAIVTRSAATPAGQVADFAMATAPTGWLECDGAAVSRTTYADLFAAIGTTWGAGDGSTTFNLPPDRYRRGRTAAGAVVGTLQADQNKSHTHTGTPAGTNGTVSSDHTHAFSWSGTTAAANTDHSHTYSGTTAGNNESIDHTHGFSYTGAQLIPNMTGGGAFQAGYTAALSGTTGTSSIGHGSHGHGFSGTTSGFNTNHTHTYSGSGSTGGISANHTHTFTGSLMTTSTGSADGSEARPLTAVFLTCIKT